MEKTIGNVVKKCFQYVEKVIVCDDGSSDDTAKIAKESGAQVIKHTKNMGKGGAMRSLFRSALDNDANVIVTIDGDGQFLPEEIPKLMKPILENRADVVIGYRFENAQQMPSYRKMGNKILDKMANLASDLPFKDTQSGFRAYSKKAVELAYFTTSGFGADAEILVNLSAKGLRISEEKVAVIYNTGGKTSTQNPARHATAVFTNTLKYVSVKRPITFYGIPGVVLIIIGSVLGYNFLDAYLSGQSPYLGSLAASIILFLSGAILCVTAVILFSMATLMRDKGFAK